MSFFLSRRNFLGGAALLALSPLLARAADAAPVVTKLARPQAKESPDKIEVIEFFSYGCNHCNDFHPILKAWIARQQPDVVVRRIPVAWNRSWENLARLYYTLESLGDLTRLDDAVFNALHKERRELFSERSLLRWYVEQGGNGEKFAATFKSFGVMSKVRQAEQKRAAMSVEGVPTLIVEGQYHIEGDFTRMLQAADQLIAQARKTLPRKK
ncbi:MAG: thiol:disulfide interchange protein DsbA/DsbL [Zoogloeaceae bacterium]|jgi:thiol:disulfide interchange protein DsbA|nr:thiol:disulfide interchange protein DsbA/DsbL [Zoogloeaceae bacterium]